MEDLFQMTNTFKKRKRRLNETALTPRSFTAQLEIFRHPFATAKPQIRQGNRPLCKWLNHRQETIVALIGGRPLPKDNLPVLIEQPTEFYPDNPAMIGFAFFADLLRRTSFANRMNQFDAKGIGDGEKSCRFQKTLRPS